jgi:protein-arginine kinase activator protein McsA
MAAMTADTDAVGDILFECGICHVTLKNIDEFNRQEHDCFKNFTQSLLASFRSFHALIIS